MSEFILILLMHENINIISSFQNIQLIQYEPLLKLLLFLPIVLKSQDLLVDNE